MADPANAVKQHFAAWIFQTPVSIFRNEANNRKVATRGPNCILDVVQNLAGSATAQRNPGQCASFGISAQAYRVQTDRQFSAFGDRKQIRVFQAKFASAILIRTGQVELVGSSVPGCVI